MDMTPIQRKRLAQALLKAFPEESDLKRMVNYGLGERLSAIAGSGRLDDIIFNLVEWAESRDSILSLLAAAIEANPTNSELSAISRELGAHFTFLAVPSVADFRPPPLPPTFVSRSALAAALKTTLLDTSSPRTIALHGIGGFGKTTLAAAVCADPALRSHFTGGVYWITLGQAPDMTMILSQLLAALTGAIVSGTTSAQLAERVANALRDRPVLLVLDDVWDVSALELMEQAGCFCTRLVTTRRLDILQRVLPLKVEEMQPTEAIDLLALQLVAPPTQTLDRALLGELATRLGAWPLLLELAGRVLAHQLALGYSLKAAVLYVSTSLALDGPAAFDRPDHNSRHAAVDRTLALSIGLLTEAECVRYTELAIFHNDTPVSLHTLGPFWGYDTFTTQKFVGRLASLALLRFVPETGSVQLPAMIRAYLLRQIARPDEAHARLVETWSDFCALPDAYAWYHLGYHLQAAHREAEWRALRLTYAWINAKLRAVGLPALLADYTRDPIESDTDLALVGGTLRRSARALIANPNALASQLLGRLPLEVPPAIVALRQAAVAAARPPWVRPLFPTLTPPGHPLLLTLSIAPVNAVAVTPDGQRVLSAGRDGTLWVWDLQLGTALYTLPVHFSEASAIALTPDGSRILSVGHGSPVLLDVATGAPHRTLMGAAEARRAIAITPDGGCAISADDKGTLWIWNLPEGAVRYCLPTVAAAIDGDLPRAVGSPLPGFGPSAVLRLDLNDSRWINSIAITPDGTRAISGGEDSALRIWDLQTGRLIATISGYDDPIQAVALTADGSRLVAGSDTGLIRIWAFPQCTLLFRFAAHTAGIRSLALSPDSHYAVSGCWGGILRLWDLQTGALLHTLTGHASGVRSVAISPDGRYAVSGGWDRSLRIWDVTTGIPRYTLDSYTERLWDSNARGRAERMATQVAAAPGVSRPPAGPTIGTHATLATRPSGTDDPAPPVGAPLPGARAGGVEFQPRHTAGVDAVTITPDGTRAISAGGNGTLRVWDITTGLLAQTLWGHTNAVRGLIVTHQGAELISASDDNTVRIWDLAKGQLSRTLNTSYDGVLALTPDGQQLIAGRPDGTLGIWDLETGQHVHTLVGHTDWVTTVAITPDRRYAVTGSRDTRVLIWDLAAGTLLHTLVGHHASVRSVAISPDARTALSGSDDGTLRLWHLPTATALPPLLGHTDRIQGSALTRDVRHAISVSSDGSLRVWSVESATELAIFQADVALSCCVVTPDDSTVVAGDIDGCVHFLRLEGL